MWCHPELLFLLFLDGWRIPKGKLLRDGHAVLGLALGLVFLTELGLFINWLIAAITLAVSLAKDALD